MIGTRRFMDARGDSAELNIAPLIDMVFILLIFFIVTTSFVREAGIDVDKPSANTAKQLDRDIIQIAIAANGTVHMDGREVSLLSVRALVRERLQQRELPVVIVSDQDSRTQALVDVIDECKLAGAENISIATEISDQ